MSIIFDFNLVEIKASATVPASTTVTICTIPLQTAGLPLSSGRACIIEAEQVVFFSGSITDLSRQLSRINGGSPPSITNVTDFSTNGVNFAINASGDLEIHYTTGPAARDVAVRVKQRWVGTS
jgi:hypothetical protein